MQSALETWFLLLSVPVYTVIIGMEILFSNWQHRRYYSLRDTLFNVLFTILNASLDLLLRGLFYIGILMWCYSHRFTQIETGWLYWLLLFIAEDLVFYVEHRIDHYCRIFWAVHVTHHSSGEFNLSTGFRSSVLQPVYRFIYFIPLALLGFHPLDIVFMYALTQTYGILVHTQYIHKMPRWFETFFVSPSHHRVHHASNPIYLDKNMGMCLIIWDKIFGSFQEELPGEPVRFGLTKPIEKPNNPLYMLFHEWVAIGRDLGKNLPLITRIKYLFMPPGWSHDGSSLTAKQLRQQLKSKDQTIT